MVFSGRNGSHTIYIIIDEEYEKEREQKLLRLLLL